MPQLRRLKLSKTPHDYKMTSFRSHVQYITTLVSRNAQKLSRTNKNRSDGLNIKLVFGKKTKKNKENIWKEIYILSKLAPQLQKTNHEKQNKTGNNT